MKHLGDITKINGSEAPVVDVITFGAPCQDLSVAGKRKGMLHESRGDSETSRSGLFHEAIRIIKEMRDADRRNRNTDVDIRPRYAIYENVPGAFSSNRGEDWRVVLEEVARIAEEGVTIPGPTKGKWNNSGVILGDSYSIAWRVFDAQYWGVPQRRRRICLVADFNGHSAAEIVFNEDKQHRSTYRTNSNTSIRNIGNECRSEVQPISQGLSGNTEQGNEKGQELTEDARRSSEASYPAFTYQDREGCAGGGKGGLIQEDKATSLRTNNYMTVFQPISNQPECFSAHGFGQYESMTSVGTLMCGQNETVRGDTPLVIQPFRKTAHPKTEDEPQGWEEADKSDTLNIFDNSEMRTPTLVVSMDRETFNCGQNFARTPGVYEDGIQPTLVARGPGGVCYKAKSTQ